MSNLFVLVAHWHGYNHSSPIGVCPTLEAAQDYALEYDRENSGTIWRCPDNASHDERNDWQAGICPDCGSEKEMLLNGAKALVWEERQESIAQKIGHDDLPDYYGEGGAYADYSIFAFSEPWVAELRAIVEAIPCPDCVFLNCEPYSSSRSCQCATHDGCPSCVTDDVEASAYVQSWESQIEENDSEGTKCLECGAPYDGDGWDGLCGNCVDWLEDDDEETTDAEEMETPKLTLVKGPEELEREEGDEDDRLL